MFNNLREKIRARALWKHILTRKQRLKYVLYDERVESYVEKFAEGTRVVPATDPLVDEQLLAMDRDLQRLPSAFMQVSISQARFLQMLVSLLDAQHVLELGTFRGLSAGFIASALPSGGKVVTIEKRSQQAAIARDFLDTYINDDVVEKIELIESDALIALKKLREEVFGGQRQPFDLVFIDADKAFIKEYLDIANEIVSPGGLIAVDNVLFGGAPAYSELKNKETEAFRKFNQHVMDHYKDRAVLLPAWDGMMLVRKNKN